MAAPQRAPQSSSDYKIDTKVQIFISVLRVRIYRIADLPPAFVAEVFGCSGNNATKAAAILQKGPDGAPKSTGGSESNIIDILMKINEKTTGKRRNISPPPPSCDASSASIALHRNECFRKAAAAYHSKQPGAAQYYSQQGRETQQSLKKERERASWDILARVNMGRDIFQSIDLHGLHVDEALKIVKALTKHRSSTSSTRPLSIGKFLRVLYCPCSLFSVTGRGSHSVSGARLQPAVRAYLELHKMSYGQPVDGEFVVRGGW